MRLWSNPTMAPVFSSPRDAEKGVDENAKFDLDARVGDFVPAFHKYVILRLNQLRTYWCKLDSFSDKVQFIPIVRHRRK
jgi:hypothetical protein